MTLPAHFKLNFLGYEFLSWLYIELLEKEVYLKEIHEEALLSIATRASLKPFEDKNKQTSIFNLHLAESLEVLQALREGALIESLQLELKLPEHVHTFALHAKHMSFSGVKSQYNFEAKDEEISIDEKDEAALLLRMEGLLEIEKALENRYAIFIQQRLSNHWPTHLQTMRHIILMRLQPNPVAAQPSLLQPALASI